MKKIFAIVLACTFAFSGCDALYDALTYEFEVKDVSFRFTGDIIDGNQAAQSGMAKARHMTDGSQLNYFTATRVVSTSELNSEEFDKYADVIQSVEVGSTTIIVDITPAGSYVVEQLTISVAGIEGSFIVPSYTAGEEFSPTEEMYNFTEKFIMALVNNKSVEVTISGYTNAEYGDQYEFYYNGDLKFTASLL